MLIINPERDLWIAVFEKALEDLTREKYERDAWAWFRSSDKGIGSFIWVCRYLGIQPTAVRRTLRQSGFGSIEKSAATLV
jgi:hypothetical protein